MVQAFTESFGEVTRQNREAMLPAAEEARALATEAKRRANAARLLPAIEAMQTEQQQTVQAIRDMHGSFQRASRHPPCAA